MASDGSPFVTIHDYITAVHPWLLALEADIRATIGVFDEPLPYKPDIFVGTSGLLDVMIWDEKRWTMVNLERQWAMTAQTAATGLAEEEAERAQSDTGSR